GVQTCALPISGPGKAPRSPLQSGSSRRQHQACGAASSAVGWGRQHQRLPVFFLVPFDDLEEVVADVFGSELFARLTQLAIGFSETFSEYTEELPQKLHRELMLFAQDLEELGAPDHHEIAVIRGDHA